VHLLRFVREPPTPVVGLAFQVRKAKSAGPKREKLQDFLDAVKEDAWNRTHHIAAHEIGKYSNGPPETILDPSRA